MPPTTFSIEHDGQRVVVAPEALRDGGKARLLLDGKPVAETEGGGPGTVLAGGGVEVRLEMPWWGGSVTRAELVRPGAEPLRLQPEAGSRAARYRRFERAHPDLYAARHLAMGVGQAILAIGLLAGLLPVIPLPSVDLPDLPRIPRPSLDLPDVLWPSIDLPALPLPGWVRAVLDIKEYWLPILLGTGAMLAERRKRARRRAESQSEPARAPQGDAA